MNIRIMQRMLVLPCHALHHANYPEAGSRDKGRFLT